MKIRYFTFLLLFVPAPALPAQGDDYNSQPSADSYTFQALVRVDDGAAETFEKTLDPGAMDTVDLGNGYRLDITAPAFAPEGTESVMIILSTLQAEKWLPMHTFRQPMRGRHVIRLGYLICRQEVTVTFPVGDSLPDC